MNDLSGLILLGLRFGLAVVLYAFLGWSILIIWREFHMLAQSTRDKQIPPIELIFEAQAGQSEEKRFYLPEFFIGRDPICECLFEDETISSKHARISYHQNQWWIEDLDSSNGTFLNDQPVTLPTVLAENDQLRCGQIEFSISFGN